MQFESFIIASIILIILPGPDLLFVITQSISAGRYNGVFAGIGLALGNLVHTCIAGFGLGLLLVNYPNALFIIKICGASYLLFLAITSFLSRNKSASINEEKAIDNYKLSFFKGLLMNVLNPKIFIFFLSFLPQFISRSSNNPQLEIISLGFIFTLMVLVIFSTLALLANIISSVLFRGSLNNKMLGIIKSIVYLFLACAIFI